jgi:hypothetical protein
MDEPNWKEIALNIQRNTEARCAQEERMRRMPLIEALAELEVLISRRHRCGDPDAECPLFDCHKPGEAAEIAKRARESLEGAPKR